MSVHHHTAKAKFANTLPTRLYASSRKDSPYRHLDKQMALRRPYIQHNSQNLVIGLTIDIDESDAAERFMDVVGDKIPFPNFYIITPKNGHLQARYLLACPVSKSPFSKGHPLRYFAAVQYGINQLVGGDPAYTNFIMKNPLHPKWKEATTWIHDVAFTLDQLARHLPKNSEGLLPTPERRKNSAGKRELGGEGRNTYLFDETRFFGYRIVVDLREQEDFSGFANRVVVFIDRKNSELAYPLPPRETNWIAKSVTNWTWKNYTPKHSDSKKIDRGVMGLSYAGTHFDLKEKQMLSAERTNQIRKDTTREKIINAIGGLTARGSKITQKAVAELSGLGIATVKRNWAEFKRG